VRTNNAVLLVFVCALVNGQTRLTFEVASVKPAAATVGGPKSVDLQQVRYTGVRLRGLLQDAYEVKRYQINGPDWLDTERYDVIAKLPEGASREQIPAMLQSLLTERFHMTVHTETRQDRVYALIVMKSGAHLKESSGGIPALEVHNGRIEFASATLDAFASVLSGYLDYPVLDMTGIPGKFDITLTMDGGPPDTIPDANFSSSILAAMPGLGLKLESRIAPLRHIIVDSAEKIPTGN